MDENFYKQLTEEAPVGYAYHKIICDDNGIPCDYEYIDANKAFEKLTNLKLSLIVGKKITDIIPNIKDEKFDCIKFYGDIAINGGKKEFNKYFETLNRWYHVNVYSPKKYYFITYLIDLSQEKAQMIELEKSKESLYNIIEATNVGTWEWNLENGEVIHNERWAEIFGYTLKEIMPVTNETWKRYVHPDDLIEAEIRDRLIFNKQIESYDDEYRMKHKNGNWVWIHDKGKAVSWSKDGNILLMSGTHTDITERKNLELALSNEKRLLETTLLSVGDGVISTDRNSKIVFLNKVAENLTGWKQEEAKERPFMEVCNIIREIDREKSEDIVGKVIRTGKIHKISNHTILISKDGTERPVEDSAAPIFQEDGEIVGAVLVFRDCYEKKKKQEEILYLSYRDQLTGLYNRRFYEEELNRLNIKRNLPLTVVMADVNGLKLINDSFGHAKGDKLLKKVAEVLKKGCRGDDVIARLGGDEFIIILTKTDSFEAEKIISRINELALNEKVGLIGISIAFGFETKYNESDNIQGILKNAEDYMYRHKLYESNSIRNKTIDLIMNTLYEKSNLEMLHSKRVSKICEEIAINMNFDKNHINQIKIAGLMHDIGKMGIDEKILNKSEGLSVSEWKEMKRHPEIGYRILSSSNDFSEMAEYVLNHHERWDGSGYPKGLKGMEISVQARIIAIADAYDAMTSDRTYRKKMSKDKALDQIKIMSGTQFDPQIANIFIKMISDDKFNL